MPFHRVRAMCEPLRLAYCLGMFQGVDPLDLFIVDLVRKQVGVMVRVAVRVR